MRCTHCFFTDELDDRPRKKLQMKTNEIDRIAETLGGNLGVLILAGGEPFTRKDLPEIVSSFYRHNNLESVYLMSNGQIQKRIFPDVTRILEECPNLNVTWRWASTVWRISTTRSDRSPGPGTCHRDGARIEGNETAVSASRPADVHLLHAFESGHDL